MASHDFKQTDNSQEHLPTKNTTKTCFNELDGNSGLGASDFGSNSQEFITISEWNADEGGMTGEKRLENCILAQVGNSTNDKQKQTSPSLQDNKKEATTANMENKKLNIFKKPAVPIIPPLPNGDSPDRQQCILGQDNRMESAANHKNMDTDKADCGRQPASDYQRRISAKYGNQYALGSHRSCSQPASRSSVSNLIKGEVKTSIK